MPANDEWTDQTAGAASKLNAMTVIGGTGTYLATLTAVAAGQIIACHTDGSIFKATHLYMWTGSAWVDITNTPHTHIDDNTGGDLVSLWKANSKFMDSGAKYLNYPIKADWIQVTDTGAAITDDSTSSEYSIKLDSGSTNGSGAHIRLPALKIDFSKKLFWQTKIKLGSTTSLATKLGPNMESTSAADNNNSKVGIESCTTQGTNWLIKAANGTTFSTTDTGIAMTTSQLGVKLEHYPSTPKVDVYLDTASTAATKTTHVPTTGVSLADNYMKFSIKNNTAASKTMFCYGFRMQNFISDVWY